MVLAIAHGLGIEDDLMLGIDQHMRVIPLYDAVGGWHLRRFIVGDVALNLGFDFASFGRIVL